MNSRSHHVAVSLRFFASRCKDLRLLNLSSQIEFSDLINFLKTCGRHLTHLRIRDQCINFNLSKIVEICQDLKELNLCYVKISDEEFLCLENLQFLECLNLNDIHIKSETLRKVLRRNPRIRHLHLHINPEYMNVDDVAVELGNSCPDLENLALLDTCTLTSQAAPYQITVKASISSFLPANVLKKLIWAGLKDSPITI